MEAAAVKILILTSSTTANVYLVNQLLQRHNIVGLVIESPPPAITSTEKRLRRRRMLRKYGFLRTANKLLLNWFRSKFVGAKDDKIIRERLFGGSRAADYQRPVPSIAVSNINDVETGRFIQMQAPDLIAICGTTVVKPEIFARAPLGAINIHTGITPEYRSADPIFWAIYCNDFEKVGVTIHFVDEGIDTGPIILQEHVPLYREDSLATIYVRCVLAGARLYLRAVDEIAAGSVQILDRSAVAGRAFYSINLGLVQYLLFRWRFKRLRRRLPVENSVGAAAESGL